MSPIPKLELGRVLSRIPGIGSSKNVTEERKIIQYWDVVAPAPKDTLKGQLMKGKLKTIGKKRRVSLEIHRIPLHMGSLRADKGPNTVKDNTTVFLEKAFLRISKRKIISNNLTSRSSNGISDQHDDDDDANSIDTYSVTASGNETITFNQGSPTKSRLNTIPECSPSSRLNTITEEVDEDKHLVDVDVPLLSQGEKWVTKYKVPLDDMKIVGAANGNEVTLTLSNHTRNVYFNQAEDAQEFERRFNETKVEAEKRTLADFKNVTQGLDISHDEDAMNETVHFLIDIVGAEKLPVADLLTHSSDPLMIARFGDEEIHRTKHISKTLNPIWTIDHNSLFIFSTSIKKLFLDADGMEFTVYDRDMTGLEELGTTTLSSSDMYKCLKNEERIELKLKPVNGDDSMNTDTGKVAVRVRRASESDIDFVSRYGAEKSKRIDIHSPKRDDKQKQPFLMEKYERISKVNGGKEYKLRPRPDPEHPQNVWKSADDIDLEVMKPSRQFRSLGCGDIAKVHVEILKCDKLPNMETVSAFGNKTDAFVQVVYEDCIGETCVIQDSNSPRWMPWTNRAFTLHTNYPSSVIYIGVHDFDAGADLISNHDLVGRCIVNVANMRPNTEYTLEYNLYKNAIQICKKDDTEVENGETKKKRNIMKVFKNDVKEPKREDFKNGSITMRVRLEVSDPRAYLMASLKKPPTVYINTPSKKMFNCIRNTVYGDFRESDWRLQTLFDFKDELLSLLDLKYYAQVIVKDILLWSPDTKLFSIAKRDISIPSKSIIFFLMAITAVEKPRLIPSFVCFSLFLLLTATANFKNSYPSAWWRCRSFNEQLLMLLLGKKAKLSSEIIAVGQLEEERKKKDNEWIDLIRTDKKKAKLIQEQEQREAEELTRDLAEAKGDSDDLSTKSNRPSLDPMILVKPYLHPIQKSLLQLVILIRATRNVVLWDESHYAFFIALVSLSLAILFWIIPVVAILSFLFHWIARVVAWGLFGPWMPFIYKKFVNAPNTRDVQNTNADTKREAKKQKKEEVLRAARIQNENAMKDRSFKAYYFGKFFTKVPIMLEDRLMDLPLPSSKATPLECGVLAVAETSHDAVKHVVGQQLIGSMIRQVQS